MAELGQTTPILRLYDEAAARAFYLDFLEFQVEFEHRFEPDTPLYMSIARGGCRIHLSGHFGDAAPGARLRIQVDDVAGFAAALRAKRYRHARPGPPMDTPWGDRELTIDDPFGNRLTFFTPKPARD